MPDGRQREEKGITLTLCIELRRWGKNTRSRRREKKSGDIFGGGPWRLQESGQKEGNLRGIFLCVLATAMIETGLFLIGLKYYIVLAPTSLAVSTKFDRQTAAFQPSLERVGYSVR